MKLTERHPSNCTCADTCMLHYRPVLGSYSNEVASEPVPSITAVGWGTAGCHQIKQVSGHCYIAQC